MTTDDPRIEQFKQMSEADPENELGHFSLGRAYLEAERLSEAVTPLARAVELNPQLSKAYQLLGQAYDGAGQRDRAVEIVTRGVTVADEQGDRMPRDAMAGTLRQWGESVPAFQEAVQDGTTDRRAAPTTTGFQCTRCRRPDGQLDKPPFKGPLGEKILENVCSSCWREWVTMGTKVINEMGLELRSPAAQQVYDQYMAEFLQIDGR
jgi:Fe-S cluster biosynthesis and repair protein YggX